MEKPISITIQEAKEEISNVINEQKLSPTILEPIIKDIYDQVLVLKQQELVRDRKQYDEYLKSQNKETEVEA